MSRPIIDTHCDLLVYMTRPEASIYNGEDIGCAVPHLKSGNVKLQVMAIFTPTQAESHQLAIKESEIFRDLNSDDNEFYAVEKAHLDNLTDSDGIGMVAAIENASGICDENISFKEGLQNLETIINNVGNLLYIGLTHHTENRFGGGNYSSAGLKKDGEALLDYLHNKNIAIDFSHTSDALAYDILTYTAKQNINIPIIASHSNYRSVFDHPRNLPDELVKEIVHKKGLVGLNFVRAFVNPDSPEALLDHLAHGIDLGCADNICYGADFFYHQDHPDKSRIPFYFKQHENASCYVDINVLVEKQFGSEICDNLSYKNSLRFLNNLWKPA